MLKLISLKRFRTNTALATTTTTIQKKRLHNSTNIRKHTHIDIQALSSTLQMRESMIYVYVIPSVRKCARYQFKGIDYVTYAHTTKHNSTCVMYRGTTHWKVCKRYKRCKRVVCTFFPVGVRCLLRIDTNHRRLRIILTSLKSKLLVVIFWLCVPNRIELHQPAAAAFAAAYGEITRRGQQRDGSGSTNCGAAVIIFCARHKTFYQLGLRYYILCATKKSTYMRRIKMHGMEWMKRMNRIRAKRIEGDHRLILKNLSGCIRHSRVLLLLLFVDRFKFVLGTTGVAPSVYTLTSPISTIHTNHHCAHSCQKRQKHNKLAHTLSNRNRRQSISNPFCWTAGNKLHAPRK